VEETDCRLDSRQQQLAALRAKHQQLQDAARQFGKLRGSVATLELEAKGLLQLQVGAKRLRRRLLVAAACTPAAPIGGVTRCGRAAHAAHIGAPLPVDCLQARVTKLQKVPELRQQLEALIERAAAANSAAESQVRHLPCRSPAAAVWDLCVMPGHPSPWFCATLLAGSGRQRP
jgi:hypothetical protein